MIKRIAITGPESTGKSSLAIALAKYFNTVAVPEYAREYIDDLNRPYCYDDIELIAKGQLQREEMMLPLANKILFCDTDILVTKVWSDFVYHKCSDWINDKVINHEYDLYLLTNVDIPWEYDPQRENPNQRQELFDIYYQQLKRNNFNFNVIDGLDEKRLQRAISFVEKII